MKVDQKTYDEIVRRLNAAKIQYRETDHGYCQSIYMASPDGLKVEFTVDPPDADEIAAVQEEGRAQRTEALARGRPPAEQHRPARRHRLIFPETDEQSRRAKSIGGRGG